MEQHHFIIIGTSVWNSLHYGIQRIACELSDNNQVMYINPFSGHDERTDYTYSYKINNQRGSNPLIKQINDNLTIFTPDISMWSVVSLRSEFIFNLLCKINTKKFAETIKWAANTMNFENYILIIDNEAIKTVYLPPILSPYKILYYRSLINLYPQKKESRMLKNTEIRQLIQADAVLATNEHVLRHVIKYNKRTFNIGNCIDKLIEELDDFSWKECMDKIENAIKAVSGNRTCDRNGQPQDKEVLYS